MNKELKNEIMDKIWSIYYSGQYDEYEEVVEQIKEIDKMLEEAEE